MFNYVYSLQSVTDKERYYIGISENLEQRLQEHNTGKCKHTIKYMPWKIEVAVAFRSKEKAITFEKYLKSHSGRAFARKHF